MTLKCGEAVAAASPRRRHGNTSVPITIGLLYREYERLLRAGELQLSEDVGCPK
jgi:hypothetical protein